MADMIRRFMKEEDGLGTVEIVLIVAVLLGIALIFRKQIIGFVESTLSKIFEDGPVKDFTDDPVPAP